MNSIKLAYRRLFRKGEHTATRIISLAAGMAFGILLLSEVLYYFSFDSFYPDSDRIYVVHENFKMDKSTDELTSYPRVSGAIAPGMKAEVPGIESATRLNSIGTTVFYSEDKKSYKGKFVLADEHLFEVLPRPMISGDPEKILKTPMNCMVSDEIATAMGGDVIGKLIEMKSYPDKKLTIAGVFKSLPENTNYDYDILISMVSTSQFTWDGTNNWLGNDRYYACVKLLPGVKPESLAPAVRKMQEKNQDIIKIEETNGGMVLKYTFKPIKQIYSDDAHDMILILSLIAFAVLFVSLMNYILLTLSVLVNRARSSAIFKCCGAQRENIQFVIFAETFLMFTISLVVALLLILALKPMAEAQLGHQLSSALNPYVIWPLLFLLLILMSVISYLPGRFFSNIPVAAAFRNFRQKGNKWKLALLFFQFIGTSFILTVLIVVSLQYNKMKNADHGYSTEGVYYASTSGMEGHKISTIMNKLSTMPEIDEVGIGSGVPLEGASGNNVLSPDGTKELFNIADFYSIDDNYLSILNIPLIEGQTFSIENNVENDILISKKCAEMLKLNNAWTDGVIGKQIEITEHNGNGGSRISGIFPDFIIHSISNPDHRPAVFFYRPDEDFINRKIESPKYRFYIVMKTNSSAGNNIMQEITDVFNDAFPHNDAVIKSLAAEQESLYAEEKGFRNAMMAGNLIIILITAIGLLGYTTSEVNRRRKELAIRKINGATLKDILKMFITDLEFIALPAVLIGLAASWFVAERWMQNFATKVSLHWWIFGISGGIILLTIAILAIINYTLIANRNPSESLRYE